jgi:predicted transcriptional regulator
MKTIEITLDDELHRRLMEASKATSQSFKQLIHDLLAQSLRRMTPNHNFSTELLAEGYQVMTQENERVANDSLAAQLLASENQSGGAYGQEQKG